MLKQLQKNKDQKGFTIIEVLIVLAIAGLILLIVFLAVPALQRNSRNTQRKTDVGRIGGAATTVVSNANGQITATTFTTAIVNAELGTNLSYYTPSTDITAAIGTQTNPANKDKVVVVGGAKCNGADATAQPRQIAVLYSIENGSGGATPLCIDQ
jgi:prepilin-type N-terminal cleavage/methylation domain-containing protein